MFKAASSGLGVLLWASLAWQPALASERNALAANLLDQMIKQEGGAYAQRLGSVLPLPMGMDRAGFLQTLKNGWQDQTGRLTVSVPLKVKNWGSGGGHEPWQFKDESVQRYFKQVFNTIRTGMAQKGYQISFSKNDLFHGHIFSFEHDGLKDFGIVFHAKEYPNDAQFVEQNGGKGADSNFSVNDGNYKLRNFVWIASASKVWLVQADRPAMQPLITADWLDPNSDDPVLKMLYTLQLKALTVQDQYFNELGQSLGSVNYFSVDAIKQITGSRVTKDILFF
ncbi:hypothetical protein [Parachitinimonas caeni]|uniref:Uncharacterized protein n=1 Tax=Parachitinimonas caeni TaxID=3031301 RepID=A0ABT7DXF3_9NEIS|nr:hypothetical protein [Parachitinimonas caeni]MDK2124744.1 hypothetical protein [Parachitinimonas caeni]